MFGKKFNKFVCVRPPVAHYHHESSGFKVTFWINKLPYLLMIFQVNCVSLQLKNLLMKCSMVEIALCHLCIFWLTNDIISKTFAVALITLEQNVSNI